MVTLSSSAAKQYMVTLVVAVNNKIQGSHSYDENCGTVDDTKSLAALLIIIVSKWELLACTAE